MKTPWSGVMVVATVLLVLTASAAEAELRLRPYVSGLIAPVAIVQDPTEPTVQFVVELGGLIRIVQNGVLGGTFLDLRSAVGSGGERGLFSIAFLPGDPGPDGRFFVCFTNSGGNIVVARFRRTANPLVADLSSRFDLVWPGGTRFIAHPSFSNHNGGHMVFGPDGYLYIGLGDGGGANDPFNNAQKPMKLLGKMLRIDVSKDDPQGYTVPSDNPFVDGFLPNTTTPVLREIWSFGLRNPWRFNFDDVARGGSGALLMGDVGQGQWEEIDYQPPGVGGRNYGWVTREGNHSHSTVLPAYVPLVNPIHEYNHGLGGSASVTGGYVYRGTALGPEFVGRYFFADFVQQRVWSMALAVDPDTDEARAVDVQAHSDEIGRNVIGNVSSFGVDADGELYLISLFTGSVLRFDLAGPADLVVAEVTPPATGVSGRTTNVTTRVRNDGDLPAAGPFQVNIYLSADTDIPGAGALIGSRTLNPLEAGAASTVAVTVTVPSNAAPGLYFVSAVVDPDNNVVESDDSNNGRTALARLEGIRPDLATITVSGPARGVIGKTIPVVTTVRNVGRATADTFTIGIYLSSAATPGSGTRIGTRAVASLPPNGITTATTIVKIPPDTPAATYFLSAVADDGRTVIEVGDADDGTNGANNGKTALAQVQVVPFLPDLEITAVSAPATMAVARPLTVAFTVRNTGTAPAGPFRVSFFLAPTAPPPAPGDGIAVGFKTFTGLAVGASLPTSAVVNVPGNLSADAYYLSAVTDFELAVPEITEGFAANGKVTARTIAVVRPDLRITRFEASVPPATARAARGGTLAIRNVTVRNFAVAPATTGTFTVKFYLSDGPTLDAPNVELTPAVQSTGLAPGASFSTAPILTIPPSVTTGAKFLIAGADALEQLFEASEVNNIEAVPIDIGDFVDLQITAVSGPAAASTDRPMTVSFTVRNAGTAPVGRFRVNLFMAPAPAPTPGAGVEVGFKDIARMGARAGLATSVVIPVPADFAQGAYILSAVADADNAVPEAGGNDLPAVNGGVASRPINVVRPDLQVLRFTGPAQAARGGTAVVTTIVKNVAASPAVAPPSILKFYVSNDGTTLDTELATVRQIPALGAGAVSTGVTTLVIPATVTTGERFLIARADALDQIPEGNEANNDTEPLRIDIGDFVDLTLTALAGPATATAGRPMTLSFTVRNAGSAPAGPFRVSFFLAPVLDPAPAPGDGVLMGFRDIKSLAALTSFATPVVVTVPGDLTAGSYVLSAVADVEDAIPEVVGDAANGRAAARAINVVSPPP